MPTRVLIENSLVLWPMRARRGLTSAHRGGVPPELVTKSQQREVLALGLEHDVELARPCRLREELAEGDRVDQIGVGAQLRQHPFADGAPADLACALLERGLRRRVVDLRGDAGRPGGQRGLERLAIRDAVRIVTMV